METNSVGRLSETIWRLSNLQKYMKVEISYNADTTSSKKILLLSDGKKLGEESVDNSSQTKLVIDVRDYANVDSIELKVDDNDTPNILDIIKIEFVDNENNVISISK